ncbi:hypothetical protein ACVBEJ_11930 [Porticoccus sp. GXU_MW_L64]
MNRVLMLILLIFSAHIFAEEKEPISCVHFEAFSSARLEDLKKYNLQKSVKIKDIAQKMIVDSAKDALRVANLTKKYQGPEEYYSRRLIELLDKPLGLRMEVECLTSYQIEGSIIRHFEQINVHQYRSGYMVLIKETPIAYFYDEIIDY